MPKFEPGEYVVCINDDFPKKQLTYYPDLTLPVRGKCYVVRAYTIHGRLSAIVLLGITNMHVQYYDGVTREAGFWDERFKRAPSIDGLKKVANEASRRSRRRRPAVNDCSGCGRPGGQEAEVEGEVVYLHHGPECEAAYRERLNLKIEITDGPPF